MVGKGYSTITLSQATEEDMKIQIQVEEMLTELVKDLEDNYGIIIDLQFSWDYYKESKEE